MNKKEFQRDFYADSWIHSKNRESQYNYDIGNFLSELVKSGSGRPML